MDIDLEEAGDGIHSGSDTDGLSAGSGASSGSGASAGASSNEDHDAEAWEGDESNSDGDVLLHHTDDASIASEDSESFPDDDTWNQYDEDEELGAEGRFRKFEEMLDTESDIDDERKLQSISAAPTTT